MVRFFFHIILLFAAISCEEENSKHWTEVSISAINYSTGEAISDINCGVLTVDDGFLFNDKTIILDERTMNNGVYHFGFKAKKNQTYWAEASFDVTKYYAVKFSSYMNVDNQEMNAFNFQFVPYAYITFDITNTSCFDVNDQLYLIRESETGYQGYSPVTLLGCTDLAPGQYGKVPSGEWYFEWQVTKNGLTTTFYDTLVLSGGDSLIYVLDYQKIANKNG